MKKNNYKLAYTQGFINDLEKVIKYVVYKLENVIAAENLLNLIESKIKVRSENPEDFKSFKLKKGKFKWYRINVNNYVIFYTVENDVMIMRKFIYSKRNLDKFI